MGTISKGTPEKKSRSKRSQRGDFMLPITLLRFFCLAFVKKTKEVRQVVEEKGFQPRRYLVVLRRFPQPSAVDSLGGRFGKISGEGLSSDLCPRGPCLPFGDIGIVSLCGIFWTLYKWLPRYSPRPFLGFRLWHTTPRRDAFLYSISFTNFFSFESWLPHKDRPKPRVPSPG